MLIFQILNNYSHCIIMKEKFTVFTLKKGKNDQTEWKKIFIKSIKSNKFNERNL